MQHDLVQPVALEDRSLRCWGANPWGQLGPGDTAQRGAKDDLGAKLPAVDLGL